MIIKSLLDTDLYKLTMMQTVLHQFPSAMAEYRFKCRSKDINLLPFVKEINHAIDELCTLSFKREELLYLQQYSFFKSDFIEFLRLFRFNRDFITVSTAPEFDVVIKGPWLHTILFEVPVLALVCEIYHQQFDAKLLKQQGDELLYDKIHFVKDSALREGFTFSDFGTRRRYSQAWQEHMLTVLQKELAQNLSGTSNILLAKKLGLRAIGTMAHEYLEACQVLGPRLALSQKFAFEKWAQEYRGELGIALSDVIGLDAFLNDFDLYFCKLFDGARHDSGDPFVWGDRLIAHYEKMRIDPKTKILAFSDSLDFPLALKLYAYFKDRARPVFGIGTNLTNDLGVTPLQIVIKMVACNGQPVAKLSDSPEKTMCRDVSYLAYLKKVFNVVN